MLCALVLFLQASPSSAQTIRPVLSEYRLEANGNFELVNNSFLPINVVIEARSFDVSEVGEITYRALDPDIHVKFSTTSFRIPPKQSFTVSYKAKADKMPAWFVVYASMTGFPNRTETGMAIRIQLPHTVYILPKKDAAKEDLKVVNASYDSEKKVVSLELKSDSKVFGRVLATEVYAGKKRVEASGFPVYGGKSRKLTVPWTESGVPDKVVFLLKDFKIEAPISNPPASSP